MSRVTQETLNKLHAFLDSLDPEVKGKCALCNETLTHIVKMAEVQTGAGTATVTRELAARVNEGAAPGDVVSGEKLRLKVRQKGDDRNLKGHNDQINPNQSQPKTEWCDTDEEERREFNEKIAAGDDEAWKTVRDRISSMPEIKPTNQPKQKEQIKKIKPELPDSRVSAEFQMAYNKLKYAIGGERMEGWANMTKDTALKHMGNLINLINADNKASISAKMEATNNNQSGE